MKASSPIRAMVMAAGAGTRLRPLTLAVPKPMVPIANRPVLEYTIENLRQHGITEIVLNLHNFPELIRKHFGDGSDWGVQIHYSYEPELLGTAGGVKKVESFLSRGTFLIMSGDGLTDIDLTRLLSFHKRKRAAATIALKPMESRFDYGVTFTNALGRITRFVEKPKWSDVFSNLVNTGIYVLEPRLLSKIPSRDVYDFGNQLWPKLLSQREALYGYVVPNYWCDVGNLNEYRRAQRDILDGKVKIKMPGSQRRRGAWIDSGSRLERDVKLESPCLIGKNCRIERGAVIGDHTVIGNRAHIGRGSVLRNCILWDDVTVNKNVHLENCVIGHHARVSENISVYEGSVISMSRQ